MSRRIVVRGFVAGALCVGLIQALPAVAHASTDLTLGAVSTFAGSGTIATVNGTGTAASFKDVGGTVLVGSSLYVSTADSIRAVNTSTAAVTTFAGGGSGCGTDNNNPSLVSFGIKGPIASDGTSVFTAMNCSGSAVTIRSTTISSGATTTFAVISSTSNMDGLTYASDGFLYGTLDATVRRINISTGAVSTFATDSSLTRIRAISADASALWIVGSTIANQSTGGSAIDRVDLSTAAVTTSRRTPTTPTGTCRPRRRP